MSHASATSPGKHLGLGTGSAPEQLEIPGASAVKFPEVALERWISSRLLDVLMRFGLVLAMAILCYQIVSPFLTWMMVWAVMILALTLYPLHQSLAGKMGGKHGRETNDDSPGPAVR